MAISDIKGYGALSSSNQQILKIFIEKAEIPNHVLKDTSCRLSKKKSLMYKIHGSEYPITNGASHQFTQQALSYITAEKNKSEQKQKQLELQKQKQLEEEKKLAFAKEIAAAASEKKFLEKLYPIKNVFIGIQADLEKSRNSNNITLRPVLALNQEEITCKKTFAILYRKNGSIEDHLKEIENVNIINGLHPVKIEKLKKAAVETFQKWKKKYQLPISHISENEALFQSGLTKNEWQIVQNLISADLGDKIPQVNVYKKDYGILSMANLSFEIRMKEETAELDPKGVEIFEKLKMIWQNRELLQYTMQKIEEATDKQSNCRFTITKNDAKETSIICSLSIVLSNRNKWSDQFDLTGKRAINKKVKLIKDVLAKAQAEYEEQMQKELEKQKSKGIYGNLLAYDIYRCVKDNESHITENTLVQILKGMNVKSDYTYQKNPAYAGKYSGMDENRIRNMCSNLTDNGILRNKYMHGDYCDYYEMKLGETDLIMFSDQSISESEFYSQYTDFDWKKRLEERKGPSENDWRSFLTVFDHENVLFTCRNELGVILKEAPEEVKTCIATLSKMEDELYKKKIYNYIAKLAK